MYYSKNDWKCMTCKHNPDGFLGSCKLGDGIKNTKNCHHVPLVAFPMLFHHGSCYILNGTQPIEITGEDGDGYENINLDYIYHGTIYCMGHRDETCVEIITNTRKKY